MDHYPQAQFEGLNDGPLLGPWKTSDSPILRRLANWEADIYAALANHPPDLLIKLEVDPAVAKARKPETPLRELQQKASIIEALEYNGCRVVSVDASKELDTVAGRVTEIVWAEIA